jgi:UDP-glucose:(heptosyl)LPS alpha-1,3-glucosyltransferase
MAMKLALIRRQFSGTGGAELYLQRLLKVLADAGHQLHLFAESWQGQPEGVTVHPVSVFGARAQRPVRFAEAVQRALGGERFDCVFSLERTWRQDVYRAGDGVHRVWLERRRHYAAWWRRPFVGLGAFHRNMMALEKQSFNPANTRHVIVNSEMVKREILEHFAFPAERIHLVRNGVDTARFRHGHRADTRARLGVKDDESLLLFVGSGWERKGLRFLLQLVADLRHTRELLETECQRQHAEWRLSKGAFRQRVRLLVVGKGHPPRGAASEDVLFTGPMDDVENAYAAADLLVFLPIYEPSANVVVEALAAGLPVVTSAGNGASELIQAGVNGSVINDPADRGAVYAAACYWLAGVAPRPIRTAADLSLARNVRETLALLERAAKEKAT